MRGRTCWQSGVMTSEALEGKMNRLRWTTRHLWLKGKGDQRAIQITSWARMESDKALPRDI